MIAVPIGRRRGTWNDLEDSSGELGQYAEAISTGAPIAAGLAKPIAGAITSKLTSLFGGGGSSKAQHEAEMEATMARKAAAYGVSLAQWKQYRTAARAAGQSSTEDYLAAQGITPKAGGASSSRSSALMGGGGFEIPWWGYALGIGALVFFGPKLIRKLRGR